MSFARFVLRSVMLSLSVALRMAIVSAAVVFAFYLGFSALLNLPLPEHNLILVVVLVAIALFLPTVLFLYLSTLRAGLVALRVTTPPDIGTLIKALIRMMRFNFMLINLFVTLFGTGLSAIYLSIVSPDIIDQLREGMAITSKAGLFSLIDRLKDLPLAIIAMYAFGVCLANGATGVSMAATAATASVRAPGHDLAWGLGRHFLQLFAVSVIFLLGPIVTGIYFLGGVDANMGDVLALPLTTTFGVIAYLIWVSCFFASAKSIAYASTLHEVEREHEDMMAAISGSYVKDDTDIRAMLDQRLEAARAVGKPKPRLAEGSEETALPGSDDSVVALPARQDKPQPENTNPSNEDREAAEVVPFPVAAAGQETVAQPDRDATGMRHATASSADSAVDDVNPASTKAGRLDCKPGAAVGGAPESSELDNFDEDEWTRKFNSDSKTDTPSSG